jgi:aspartyl/glutamyl-tRNA(Asn/Gln) amidotransferase C subunit
MKIDIKELKTLGLSLHFEMDDQQLEKLHAESEFLLTSLQNLNNLQVEGFAPLHYPFKNSLHSLREDIAIKNIDSKKFLKNAKQLQGSYVVVK